MHVIAKTAHVSAFQTITQTTGGTFHDKGDNSGDNIANALESISKTITSGFTLNAMEFQIGHTKQERFRSSLPLDSTLDALGLDRFSLETPQDAQKALEQLQTARDVVLQNRAVLGAQQNTMRTLHQHTQQEVETQAKQLANLDNVDLAREVLDYTRN